MKLIDQFQTLKHFCLLPSLNNYQLLNFWFGKNEGLYGAAFLKIYQEMSIISILYHNANISIFDNLGRVSCVLLMFLSGTHPLNMFN